MVAAHRRKAGVVLSAQLLEFKLHQDRAVRGTPAQLAGINYETKVRCELAFHLENFTYHPALEFRSKGRLKEYAIPDGLALNTDGSIVTIVEIKLRHTEEAYKQINNLYLPVVKKIWPEKHVNRLEVCSSYDPEVQLPERVEVVNHLEEWVEKRQPKFGVYIWSGR